MKKLITPTNFIIFLWGPLYVVMSLLYPDYTRYYLYLSLPIFIPLMIANLIKQRKEDKVNDTNKFQSSIYRMLLVGVVLVFFFFVTKQNHL